MPRRPASPLVLVAAAAVLLFLAWVGLGGRDDRATTTPPASKVDPRGLVGSGTVAAQAEAAAKTLDEIRAARDKDAHGLLDSFKSRVVDPRRDGLVDHLEGTVDVRVQGRDAQYRFVYDVGSPAEAPVKLEPVVEPPGLDSGTAAQIRHWTLMACCGPFGFVAYHVPPIPLELVPATDPKSRNKVIFARAFHSPLNVSYSVDERQLVSSRGEWTDAAHKFATSYDWERWHGLWILRKAAVFQGSTTQFDYADVQGVPLLERAHLREADNSFEAAFKYQVVRRRPN